MRGTLVCALTDDADSAAALALSAELSERIGLRLVLKLFAFSGNSVANGASTSESTSGSRPALSATWRR